jgi:hypothetical protein
MYNGATVSLMFSLPVVGYGTLSGEHHADVIPIGNNEIIIGNIYDDDSAGYYSIYNINGTLLQTFTGVSTHFSDNKLVKDSLGNIVIGGEDETGCQASITLLTASVTFGNCTVVFPATVSDFGYTFTFANYSDGTTSTADVVNFVLTPSITAYYTSIPPPTPSPTPPSVPTFAPVSNPDFTIIGISDANPALSELCVFLK